jgi:demethylmenaquinone methyltransferase / 2-methoxy-6-polyprenyl-1,4-benzoquinol methylase
VNTALHDPTVFAQDLFDGLPRRYDALAEVLSFAQNRRWRAEMVSHAAAARPEQILDVATGTAGVALALVRRTRARVTGVDVTPAMLGGARVRIARAGAEPGARIQLVAGQAERLPFPDATFDALTFTYLLRYVSDPEATLREIARVVKPGGTIASLEFAVPENRFWRAWWWLYTRFVLPAAGFVTGGREWYEVGRFLGPNITQHYRRYPVSWTVRAWEAAGLTGVRTRAMSLGGGIVMWGRKGDGEEPAKARPR